MMKSIIIFLYKPLYRRKAFKCGVGAVSVRNTIICGRVGNEGYQFYLACHFIPFRLAYVNQSEAALENRKLFYCERWRTNGFIYCIYANRRTLIYVCINHFFSSMLCINHDV